MPPAADGSNRLWRRRMWKGERIIGSVFATAHRSEAENFPTGDHVSVSPALRHRTKLSASFTHIDSRAASEIDDLTPDSGRTIAADGDPGAGLVRASLAAASAL
ncbi:MAG: hypothetical protein QOI61_853 [Actinomycetota bacterium]